MAMRGLTVFIGDIRSCRNAEAEKARVDKEIANICAKFASRKSLSSYDRRKYVWKMVYMYTLGYEVDFGHMEIINLLTSTAFNKKLVGYVAASTLLNNASDMMKMVVSSVLSDLRAGPDTVRCLALTMAANMGAPEFVDTITMDVQNLLLARDTAQPVRKKAAHCALRMFRSNPEAMSVTEWVPNAVRFLEAPHIGVQLAIANLVYAMCEHSREGCDVVVPSTVAALARLVMRNQCTPDYLYYSTPSPWLQVRLLRLLQLFPAPADATLRNRLNEVLNRILSHTDVTKSVNKNNADHAILFEAINLLISQGREADSALRNQSVTLLGRFIAVREPNIRYLGLETMTRLALVTVAESGDKGDIKKHQNTVLFSLKDADVSIRRRALDVLFVMCDSSNAESIVKELVDFLVVADVTLKEEMVLKIAILAERYAPNYTWYLDTILKMLSVAGDFVSDVIWHRVVQIASNHKDLQKYAAGKLFRALLPAHVHAQTIKVGAYVLGEYGYLLSDDAEERGPECADEYDGVVPNGTEQFRCLHKHFDTVDDQVCALLLHSFAKFANLYPELAPAIRAIMEGHQADLDNELQQRAVEYLHLPEFPDVFEKVLEAMPAFAADRESVLEVRLREREAARQRVKHDDDEEEGEEGDDDDEESEEDDDEDTGGAANTEEDLLQLDDNNAAPAPGSEPAETRGVDPSLAPQLRAWFTALLRQPKGILYEDSVIRVGCQHAYREADGKMMLYINNKSSAPVTNFHAEVPEVPAVRVQCNPAFSELSPGESGQQPIILRAMQPFAEPLVLKLSFRSGNVQYTLPLRVPAMVHSFSTPVTLEAAAFGARWKALEGQGREAQRSFTVQRDIDSSAVREAVTQGLRMAIAPGVDTTPNTVTAASTYRTGTTNANGQPISVGCLLRVEINTQARAFRVTVRTTHPVVSKGYLQVASSILS